MGRGDEGRSDPDDPARDPAGDRIRPRHHASRRAGHERGDDGGLPQVHRQPSPDPDWPEGRVPGDYQPVPLDERDHGLEEGEELLRDASDRVSDWWCVELGLTLVIQIQRLP